MAEERVQRRLAAILAADVVGYSRLMEADEAGTLARLKSLRAEIIDPRIAEDGGRIVKTMGDGILVEFPSAVDAVNNALAIQHAIGERDAGEPEDRRMEFRVGVNLGDVIVVQPRAIPLDLDHLHDLLALGVDHDDRARPRVVAQVEPRRVHVAGSFLVLGHLEVPAGDVGEASVR